MITASTSAALLSRPNQARHAAVWVSGQLESSVIGRWKGWYPINVLEGGIAAESFDYFLNFGWD